MCYICTYLSHVFKSPIIIAMYIATLNYIINILKINENLALLTVFIRFNDDSF